MKKLSVAILMLVALSQWAAPVMAHGPGMGGPRGYHMMGDGFGMLLPPFMISKLNLTDDQKAKVQEIMDAHHQTLQTLSPQLQTLHEQMADKFSTSSESLTDTDFTSQIQDMNRLREQLGAEDLKVSLALRALLTPAQLAQVAQIRAQMKALHAQMQSVLQGQ